MQGNNLKQALAPFSSTPKSFDTTLIFTIVHLESNVFFPLLIKDYEPNKDLEFSFDYFNHAF